MQPRDCLENMWRFSGIFMFALGVIRMLDLILAFATGSTARVGGTIWGGFFNTELLIIGALEMWPSFRIRAQAALMARGGQISSAAGVAALLGDHSIDHIKTVAKQRFHGVNAGKVTFKHVEHNKARACAFW